MHESSAVNTSFIIIYILLLLLYHLKLGYNSMDNGFLRFNSVVVEEDRLLNGVARISENGVRCKKKTV